MATRSMQASRSEESGKQREFQFTDRDFKHIRDFIYEHTGIVLSDAKRDMVYSRLARRLRKLGLASFTDYLDFVSAHEDQELGQFVNALTTNLTAFFRESHHFAHLANDLVASWAADPEKQRIRIWSAGCSTGEEPYSIAMTLLDALPDDRSWDVRILATDLDSDVVARAETGIYAENRIDGLDKDLVSRWFMKGKGQQAGMVRVRPELQEIISFRQLNLLHEWPFKGPLDVIFCRNVVIYFDKQTQKKLFNRYADLMPDDGALFIGHSETLFRVSERFRSLGNTIYRKTS